MKPRIKIEVVSDVVCPWCYIGKRRLEAAMQTLKDEFEFDIEYHPFELNPEMPAGGAPQREYLVRKFGSEEKYDEMTAHVTGIAAADGLAFNFDAQHTAPNTRKAHSLLQMARAEGKQAQLVELLFESYFTKGTDLSKQQNLVEIATRAGLDPIRAEAALADENSLLQVALEEQEMYRLGITGVPFYIINKRYGVSGAQAAETFVRALREAGKEIIVEEGQSCNADSGKC